MQRCLVLPLLTLLAVLAALGAAPRQALAGAAATPVDPARSTLVVLTEDNRLLRVNAGMPLSLLDVTAVTGLQAGETIHSLDARPATGALYALGSSGTLYTVDPNTGAATPRVFLAADPNDTTDPYTGLAGAAFSIDFNPVVDRLRVVSSTGQNLRVHPNTGAVTTDTPLAFAPGDPNNAPNPNVAAIAYSNNVPGATATTLYGIARTPELVVTVGGVNGTPSPNGGQLSTVLSIEKPTIVHHGFDIAPDGTGFIGVNYRTQNWALVAIDLSQNPPVTTDLGYVGNGRTPFRDFAVVPSVQVSQPLIPVVNEGTTATVTVTRTGGTAGTVTVHYTTADGSALAVSDYQPVTGTLTFGPGETTQTIQIPVFEETLTEEDETFALVLRDPTGGVTLGGPGAAIIRISTNDNVDRAGPRLLRAGLTGPSRGITGAVFYFDEDLNFIRARNSRNYAITGILANGRQVSFPISTAEYDPAMRAVRVRVSRTFQQTQFRFLALQVRGGRTGVTDRRGNAPAGNPRLLFRILHGSRVTFTEPDGDSATIDVTTPNGEVFLDLIQLVGNKPLVQAWITDPIPGFTTPVVGVRRGRLGDGLIVISEIIGLDKKEFTPLLSNTSFRVNTLTFSSNATGRF